MQNKFTVKNHLNSTQIQTVRSSNKNSSSRAQSQQTQFNFSYSFNEYLKLILAQIIPAPGIVFIPQAGRAVGARDKLAQLDQQVSKQLSQYAFRFIKFKKNGDIDEIQFSLNHSHKARIIRTGVVIRGLQQLSKYNYFRAQCQQLEQKLKSQKKILIRVPKKHEVRCLEQIQQLLRQQQQQKSYPSFLKQMQKQKQSFEEIQEEQVNFYKMAQKKYNQMEEQAEGAVAVSTYSYAQTSSLVLTEGSIDLLDETSKYLNSQK